MSHPNDSQELDTVPKNPRRFRWWIPTALLVIAGVVVGGVSLYMRHRRQVAPAATEETKVTKVEPCDLDHLTSQEDRAQLAKLQAENKEIAATEDSSEKALVEEFALVDRFATVPVGLPSFEALDIGRRRHTMKAQWENGRCVLQNTVSDTERLLSVTWSRVASTVAKAFGGLELNSDVKARKKERVVDESGFVFDGWSGLLYSYEYKPVLEGVLVNEGQLHTLMPWALVALPTLVEPAGMDMDELLVWLADYHKVAKAGGFASFDKARIKADDKRDECYEECEGKECDRCPEDFFVNQGNNILRAQILRRWLKVRGEITEGMDKDTVKAAEAKADQMLLVWRFWLARTAEALGDVKSAKAWASALGSKMQKAVLEHRDYYLGEIARMKALKPPPKS